ncbi:hypothetical protein G4X40_16800 [Rhodococcus sp. D2-41]|uniref:hypothetical protein n=1 Tax=Speluncibacter jeojiensis TaxID=2710754 RepID=UPI00240EB8C9|nr:hypothetical protein [Rhodococcus sp. D2-41]MDG3011806.1 hypothetical protein [Rhodococcus sp. D2-41]
MAVFLYIPAADTAVPLGVYLSANLAVGPYTSAPLSPIAPLPAWPDTQITGSSITIPWDAPATVVFTCPSAFPNNGTSIVLQVNGTQVASGTSSPVTWSGTLKSGDTVTAVIAHNNGGIISIRAGATDTFVTVAPA